MTDSTCNAEYQSMSSNTSSCGRGTMICMFIVFIVIIIVMTIAYLKNPPDSSSSDHSYVNDMETLSNTVTSITHYLRG
jgi:hypothetical protein